MSGKTCKIQAGGLEPPQGPRAGSRVAGSGFPHPPVLHVWTSLSFMSKGINKMGENIYEVAFINYIYIYIMFICSVESDSW